MLADEGAFIGGVALTMTAITLLVSLHPLQHSSRLASSAAVVGGDLGQQLIRSERSSAARSAQVVQQIS